MKTIILTISTILLVGCAKNSVPIEKYGSSKYVVASKQFRDFGLSVDLQLKNKDTIFWINVLKFDGENIKVGDTIR